MKIQFLLAKSLTVALLILTTTCYAETRQEAVKADQYQNPKLLKLVGFEESKSDCKYPLSMDPVFEDGRITGWVVQADSRCKE